jgi:hypothetical protein
MKIELHNINACGFYQRASTTPLFGGLNEWVYEFYQWIHSRPNVASTTVFEGLDVYCAGCIPGLDGIGVKLWHGTPATESGVAYIDMSDLPGGSVTASEQPMPSNSIPGWPSFFWILPESHMIVTLQHTGRIRNRSTGIPQLRDYFEGYLKLFSPYVVFGTQHHSSDVFASEVTGYRPLNGTDAYSDLYLRMGTSPCELPSELEVIFSQSDRITKLVSTVQISRSLPLELGMLESALHTFGWGNYSAPAKDLINMHWETDWQPNSEELDGLIQGYRARCVSDLKKERVGVRFRGEAGTHWLDTINAHAEVVLPEELEHALDWNGEQIQQAWQCAQGVVQLLLARVHQ